MIYLESPSTDPYWNLALEEFVFEHMDHCKQYFMLWQNDKAVVVGKYQNTAEEIDPQYVDEHQICVVRRLSGGGAVYHDMGNLNYTFIVDQEEKARFDFKEFAIPVIKALKRLGVPAEFNGRNDLIINGKKFAGNAQYAKNGRLLHHGCIMLDSNLEDVSNALRVRKSKFESKGIKSVRSRVTTINANSPCHISMDDFKACLKNELWFCDPLQPVTLTSEQLAKVQELRDTKYSTWEWNYGSSPDYLVRKERKFSFGTVTACLNVKKGCIAKVQFFGDFFGNGEIKDLESNLLGAPLNKQLRDILASINVEYYIDGLADETLYQLLVQ